jgi:hypothetical protein
VQRATSIEQCELFPLMGRISRASSRENSLAPFSARLQKVRTLRNAGSEVHMALALLHHPWIRTAESVLGHIAAVIVGFVLMVVGLALGVTVVMLPAGIVIGLVGVAMFVGGLFAQIGD